MAELRAENLRLQSMGGAGADGFDDDATPGAVILKKLSANYSEGAGGCGELPTEDTSASGSTASSNGADGEAAVIVEAGKKGEGVDEMGDDAAASQAATRSAKGVGSRALDLDWM